MSTMTDSIGRVLARRYRIEAALGTGTSATVYAAWDVVLQRRVAVKVLHPGLAADEAFLRRFRYEAQSAAALTHPHVLSIFDWGEDDRGPFLVLEYLGGGSLRDLLDNGRRLSVSQATAVGAQAAQGLAYAHGRGFVHRDVKPANVVFDEEGRLRLADFGLARALAESSLTEPSGASVGTARYTAPEQALGRAVDGRADVYSLALVLYEAVTGVVPFTADTTTATLMARVGTTLPGHDRLGPLAEVLTDAAAPETADRLEASTLGERLTELGRHLPPPEALPLAGTRRGQGMGPAGSVDGTVHGLRRAAPPPTGEAVKGLAPPIPIGTDTQAGDGSDAYALASAVGVTTGPHDSGDRKRRRWPWVVTVVVLICLMAGAAGAYAAARAKLFTPSHRVPSLVGMTAARATQALRPEHFSLQTVRHRSSLSVPSGEIIRQTPGSGTMLKEGSTVSVVVSTGPPPVAVPPLGALTGDCPSVVATLSAAHLRADCTHANSTTVKQGGVISWSPHGQAPELSTIHVVVSSGPPIVAVPSLSGSTCAGATTALGAVGLVAQCQKEYTTSGVPTGQVVSWTPNGNVPQGTTVTVQISEGPPLVTVPDVTHDSVSAAINALEQVGLVPGTDQGSLVGKVFATNPAAGASVPEGTTVTLYTQ
jgi:eukaryotic-like serine/threonine-protein kinase